MARKVKRLISAGNRVKLIFMPRTKVHIRRTIRKLKERLKAVAMGIKEMRLLGNLIKLIGKDLRFMGVLQKVLIALSNVFSAWMIPAVCLLKFIESSPD